MSNPTSSVPALPSGGHRRAWWRAPGASSALAWAVAEAARRHDGPLLAITADNHAADRLETDLQVLLEGDAALPVVHFPDWETLPYDQFSPHPEIVSRRLAALQRLPALGRGVVIVPVATLMQRLPPTRYIAGNSFDVAVGQTLDLDAERLRLQAGGYRLVPQVWECWQGRKSRLHDRLRYRLDSDQRWIRERLAP